MLDVLVPFQDNLLRAYYSEELIKLILKSPFRDRLLEFDPLNTYEKTDLVFPEPGEAITFLEEPTPMTIHTAADEEVLLQDGRGSVALDCSADPVTEVLTHNFGTEDFTVTNGLSSHIVLLPGLTIRLQSDFATADPYVFKYTYSIRPRVDWIDMLRKAGDVDRIWADPELKNIWDKDPLWTNRLAAFAVSTVELFYRGRKTTKI